MKKKWKVPVMLLLFFFSFPIIVGKLPLPNNKKYEIPASQEQLVYASVTETPAAVTYITQEPSANSLNVLLLFTHSHETYKPYVLDKQGKTAVYDTQINLYSMKKTMTDYFRLNGINAETLDVDVMKLLKEKGYNITKAYDVVRPYVKEELKKKDYDLIIDVHRDSISRSASTVTHQQVNYAKIAFIIGGKNPNYKINKSYADKISKELDKIIPNISRGVIEKNGHFSNSKYNQDLSEKMILVEIGGIENTEDEVFRSISVLAQAIAKSLNK